MACGLLLVTADCGRMREAVLDGVEGFITLVYAPEAIAQALHRLWVTPDLQEQMGLVDCERTEKEFTLEHQTQQLTRLFNNLTCGVRDRQANDST